MNRSKLASSPFMAALYALAAGRWMKPGDDLKQRSEIERQKRDAAYLLSVIRPGNGGGNRRKTLPAVQRRVIKKRHRQARKAAQRRIRVG